METPKWWHNTKLFYLRTFSEHSKMSIFCFFEKQHELYLNKGKNIKNFLFYQMLYTVNSVQMATSALQTSRQQVQRANNSLYSEASKNRMP